ncbi:flagellar biosynthetic protein FliO [Shewanella sp. WXL01]|uniref:Flagellar protein n=2 Tax=Shewanellaceae TaxID=267890 RepID=A0A411PMN9_9GAMM|nr:flagellar biosynthetic protein FliO [Shewanella sp. WXL01]QBF84776.1 flagellar biosynthetic protein FliO [Shewanella maritima]
MLGGLLVVLALIFVLAYIVKRLNIMPNQQGTIKTIAATAIGQREKLMVVELAGQQYFIGVTPEQISLLDKLDEPISIEQPTKFADKKFAHKLSFADKLKQAKEQQ